jgi:hypothetical protein
VRQYLEGNAPMHGECRRMHGAEIKALARICQYPRCPTPRKLLGHKAASIGTRMHRFCAGQDRSRRLAAQKRTDKTP